MDLIFQGLGEAASRLVSLDPDVREATSAALAVSGIATALSVATGVPAGAWLGLSRFRGRKLLLSLVNTGMGLPPVVVGLFVAVLSGAADPSAVSTGIAPGKPWSQLSTSSPRRR